MESLLSYVNENLQDILFATGQHALLCIVSIAIGSFIALAISSITVIYEKNIDRLISVLSFIRLIPGIAILMLGMPVLGVGGFASNRNISNPDRTDRLN